MRYSSVGATILATILVASAPGLAEEATKGQPPAQQPAAAPALQPADSGWRFVVYPVYGWLPIYRAKTRLPDRPGDGGGIIGTPRADTDAKLNSALLAAARVEKGRFSLEGGFVYAGLSGEVQQPLVKLKVDAFVADLRAGYAVARDFYVEAGAREISLDASVTTNNNPSVSWNPSIVEPVVGLTYRPLLSKNWRLILHGDLGGLGTGDSTTAAGTVRVEWQAAKHLILIAGGTAQYLKTEGKIRGRSVELDQTLYGPILGFGIPF